MRYMGESNIHVWVHVNGVFTFQEKMKKVRKHGRCSSKMVTRKSHMGLLKAWAQDRSTLCCDNFTNLVMSTQL